MSPQIRQQLIQSWTRLFGYACSLTGDRDRAAEILQQAALRVLEAKQLPKHDGAVRAWLFRIVRNVWIDQYRHNVVREKVEVDSLVLDENGIQIWTYSDRLIAEMTVRKGLGRIEAAHREIIELVDLHGFRYAEAAQILGVPEGTVMSRLSRARLALLEAIGDNVIALESAKRRLS